MISYDKDFLKQLDKARIRTHYAKITLLTFQEEPITEIQGKITAGNISVNSSSAIRRTLSLTMAIDNSVANITDIENQISINKKVKVEVGLKNPFPHQSTVQEEIIWFPQGIYVLSSANSSRGTNSWTLSITAKDKMCLLDGTAGGTFPASIVFHERDIKNPDGSITIQHPTIRQIIYEAVNHYGCEIPKKIFINLDEQVKRLMKYDGYRSIYVEANSESVVINYSGGDGFTKITTGEDAGYEMTDFTYPGELILNAGETVATLLDKITKVLGNYEYFYDIDGNFIFQEIANYVNNQSPLNQLETAGTILPNLPAQDYVRIYNNKTAAYSLTDLDTTASVSRSPKFDNIKNDFYVWGQKDSGAAIRYHLSIDAKPKLDLAHYYMYEIKDSEGYVERYDFFSSSQTTTNKLIGPPCEEWREELYRQALVAKTQSGFGSYNNYYDEELLTKWRKLYNPNEGKWEATNHWNPDVYDNPGALDFWLDFIDTNTDMGSYSVGEIGRRTKTVNNDSIKTIYNKEVPDIVFIPSNAEDRQKLIEHYGNIGQKYCLLSPQFWDMFSISSTGASCYDEIRNLMYQHFNYNTTINVTCIPIYYLEPNNILYVEDVDSGIIGNFQITQFNLPLTYNGTMSISATEVFTRI